MKYINFQMLKEYKETVSLTNGRYWKNTAF